MTFVPGRSRSWASGAGWRRGRAAGVWREVSVQRPITPARSAVLVCDMWDAHWCRTAAERSALLAERIDELLREARSAGARIVHSPSDTLERYESTPQRHRMRDLPPVEPPEPLELPDVDLPIDDSDGGCDTGDCQPPRPRTRPRPWRRKHEAIEIADEDVISEDGAEIYSMLRGGRRRHPVLHRGSTSTCACWTGPSASCR